MSGHARALGESLQSVTPPYKIQTQEIRLLAIRWQQYFPVPSGSLSGSAGPPTAAHPVRTSIYSPPENLIEQIEEPSRQSPVLLQEAARGRRLSTAILSRRDATQIQGNRKGAVLCLLIGVIAEGGALEIGIRKV